MASSQSTRKLQVSDEGLRLEVSSCESLAGKLAGNRAPAGVGALGLASAAAINAARAEVAAVNSRCVFRVRVESFNSRIRDECLNINSFWSLAHARVIIGDWKADYNGRRRHSALGYQPPAVYAATCSHR